ISPSWVPMSPSRASARTVSESMRTLTLSLGAISSSIACRGHAFHHDYIADPEARRPRHVVDNEISEDGERARIAVDRHTARRRHAVGGDVTVGRPNPAGGEDICVAMPERIECVDDRSLLIADHPHFLEMDTDP